MALMNQTKGRYILKVSGGRGRASYFVQAGTSDDGSGESKPLAETTQRIYDAHGFETYKQAERMRRALDERYGLVTVVMERRPYHEQQKDTRW